MRKGEERLQLREEGHDSQQSDADTVYSRTYILFADFHNPLSNLCQCMLGCEININKNILRRTCTCTMHYKQWDGMDSRYSV